MRPLTLLLLRLWVACSPSPVAVGADTGPAPDAGSDPVDAGARAALEAALDAVLGGAVSPLAMQDASRCPSAVGVVVTAEGVLVRGYGLRGENGSGVPTAQTVYQVGSVTKVFTGLGLAQLTRSGRADAGAPLRDHLGPDLASVLPALRPTLAQLASHTGGLPSMPSNLPTPVDGGVDPLGPASGYSRAALVAWLSTWTPQSPVYRYSNLGQGLLGLALSDTLDAGSYHRALSSLVLQPLGLHDTWGQLEALDAAARARVALGHHATAGRWTPGRLADMGALAGGGEVAMSGDDLARFLRALSGLDEGPLAEAIALAGTPVAPMEPGRDVGYGLVIEHRDGGDVWLKAGNTPSYGAFIAVQRAPALGVGVMAACGTPFPVDQVALDLFERARAALP